LQTPLAHHSNIAVIAPSANLPGFAEQNKGELLREPFAAAYEKARCTFNVPLLR
jgi:hypothetical protein